MIHFTHISELTPGRMSVFLRELSLNRPHFRDGLFDHFPEGLPAFLLGAEGVGESLDLRVGQIERHGPPATATSELLCPGIQLVRLVRPGVGVQRYRLRKGATLADLLRKSKATTTRQAVYLDGVLAAETTPLRDGAIVMIVPQPKNAAVDEPWRATIPSFQDESLFTQYMETLKARRHDLADEDPER